MFRCVLVILLGVASFLVGTTRTPAHPPSTSCPCPAWLFRFSSPLFGWSETAVQKGLAPLKLLALVQFRQECPPNGEPNALLPLTLCSRFLPSVQTK